MCKGTARLLGIWPPTDTMQPEQPWRGVNRIKRMQKRADTKSTRILKQEEEEGRKDGRRETLPISQDLHSETTFNYSDLWSQWKYETSTKSWSWSCHGFSYHRGRCMCESVCVYALLLITACSPFSCLADPRGMLFPWQCQVVSLHYSWPCSPAPVQGLSPCSNAIFITHTYTNCSCERGIDGNAISLNKQTLNHTLIPSQL